MSAQELLLCPFCGARAVLCDGEAWDEGFSVECENQDTCCAYMGCSAASADAVAAWNRRSIAPMLAAQGDDKPMTLAVALDFADNPRPRHTLAAPADTNGELYRALRVLAAAYRAAQPVAQTGVPEGYVLVPKLDTPEMSKAYSEASGWPLSHAGYSAMLAAAPTPSKQCEHEWVSADNHYAKNVAMCVKCHMIASASDVMPSKQSKEGET